MGWLLFIITAVVGVIAGKIMHELTHAATAWLVGARNIHLEVFTLGHQHVTYEVAGGRWRHHAIGLSPLIVGFIVLLPGYLALQGRFSWDIVDLGFLFAWVWYTLFGGIEDYRFERAREPTGEAAD